ncbi:MAG: hypothetical protein KTR26_20105 [Flammeovirgaceae bacterium]|nr:hypothetical protein [Flammeovirgaceae bacterium]
MVFQNQSVLKYISLSFQLAGQDTLRTVTNQFFLDDLPGFYFAKRWEIQANAGLETVDNLSCYKANAEI